MKFSGIIYAEAVLKPKNGGKSFLEDEIEITAENLKTFWADPASLKEVVTQFKTLGFKVTTVTKIGFFFSGSAHLFEDKFAADGEKISIEIRDHNIVNASTEESIIRISPSLFDGYILAVLISSPARPLTFDTKTKSGWPESDEEWSKQKEIALAANQTQMWQLPKLLKAETINNEKHLKDFEEGRWPYKYSGEGVNVHVIDSGLTDNHPYFEKALGSGYKEHWNLQESTANSSQTNCQQIYKYIGITKLNTKFFDITNKASVESFN